MEASTPNGKRSSVICSSDIYKCPQATSAAVSESLLLSVATRYMESDGFSLCGETEDSELFDLVFRKDKEFSFVKVTQVAEFNEEKSNFVVPADEWPRFVECAAATVHSFGIKDRATVCLEEIKMIVTEDGRALIQRIIGRQPLKQAA